MDIHGKIVEDNMIPARERYGVLTMYDGLWLCERERSTVDCAYLDYIQLGNDFFQGSRFTFTIRPLPILLELSPSFPVDTIGNRSEIRHEQTLYCTRDCRIDGMKRQLIQH